MSGRGFIARNTFVIVLLVFYCVNDRGINHEFLSYGSSWFIFSLHEWSGVGIVRCTARCSPICWGPLDRNPLSVEVASVLRQTQKYTLMTILSQIIHEYDTLCRAATCNEQHRFLRPPLYVVSCLYLFSRSIFSLHFTGIGYLQHIHESFQDPRRAATSC